MLLRDHFRSPLADRRSWDGFHRQWPAMIVIGLNRTRIVLVLAWAGLIALGRADAASNDTPPVTAPPESFFAMVRERDRDAARRFYKKYIDVDGMPVVAAAEVADEALQRTHDIVTHMLAGRPDVLEAMVEERHVPDHHRQGPGLHRHARVPEPSRTRRIQNERVRGTGGRPHQLRRGEPAQPAARPLRRREHRRPRVLPHDRRRAAPDRPDLARAAGRRLPERGRQGPVEVRLRRRQPGRVLGRDLPVLLRLQPRQQLEPRPRSARASNSSTTTPRATNWSGRPSSLTPGAGLALHARCGSSRASSPPPAKFKIDPYYTKFTWAREFTVLGSSSVSDEALLKANDTIRKMFAYRHDILKALIADGVRLVVLGPAEKISDLPEYRDFRKPGHRRPRPVRSTTRPRPSCSSSARRMSSATPTHRERRRQPGDPRVRQGALSGDRHPAGRPRWDNRGRNVQQYELRVKRLDVRFDERIEALYEEAMNAGKWTGTAAAHDRAGYWAAGVLAYFDALGQDAAPPTRAHPISTREALKDYDPDLYALVHETMAYDGHVDWRFQAARP